MIKETSQKLKKKQLHFSEVKKKIKSRLIFEQYADSQTRNFMQFHIPEVKTVIMLSLKETGQKQNIQVDNKDNTISHRLLLKQNYSSSTHKPKFKSLPEE